MFRRGKIPNPGVSQFRKVEAWALLNAPPADPEPIEGAPSHA